MDDPARVAGQRLCDVCSEVVGVTGAGIMLMSGDVPRGSVCTTDDVSALVEELQFELGEGPCVDAYHLHHQVLEPDLGDPVEARWPAFTPPALEAGVRAVYGYPLLVGAVCLGALNLYNDRPGPLSDDQHVDALVMAGVAAEAVLAMHARDPGDGLAALIETGANFRFVVHQASGMVSVQLGVGLATALIRLRAHAFASGLPVSQVARDVVERRLRFDARSGETAND